MPWKVRKKKNQYCVEKVGGGEVPGGCHDTQEEANAHQRALYAREKMASGGAIIPEIMFTTSPAGGTVFEVTPSTLNLGWTVSGNPSSLAAASVTVTVGDGEETSEGSREVRWQALMAFEGKATDDRRYLMPEMIDHRELPLSIMSQTTTADGHAGAELAARVDEMWWQESEVEEGVMEIWGRGSFDTGEAGQEAIRLIEGGFLRGISIDFAPKEYFLLDPETKKPIDTEGMDALDAVFGDYLQGYAGSIMGATFVPFAAFADAHVEVITAGGKIELLYAEPLTVLTASAAGMAPLAPPLEWFGMPEANGPTPLTVTDDGRVYGHLATWDECHTGFTNVCTLAPRSRSDYSCFHLGEIKTAGGERVSVGRITVGEKGHAPIHLDAKGTIEHYDNTGCVAAFVRATDGRHGIWLSGAVRSDAPAEKVRDLMANPPSGDWRMDGGALELQGVLSVPIPGFPVPRSELRLVASGGDEIVEALVASAYEDAPLGPRAIQRKRSVLRSRLTEALGIRERSRAEQRAAAMSKR